MATVLRGGRVLDPTTGTDATLDVEVRDGRIVALGDDVDPTGAETLDVTGCWITPGFVDLHVHLREPGFEDAEDVGTGSAAAAAGGFTAVCPMANTDPVTDSAAVAELVWRRGREVGLADVFPLGSITKRMGGSELTEQLELHRSAARVDAFSDDGLPVADSLVMRRALQYATHVDAVIVNHAQDPALTADAQMHEGELSAVLGLPGWPREAEELMIARDLLLAAAAGARLHVPHVSTAGAVELIRAAKSRGVRVTAEVTPHHLSLTHEVVRTYDPVYKVNPPVRTAEDVEALREALIDGTVDAVATDHAPHAPETKDQEWEHAPCGMLGLETAFAVVHTELVATGRLSPLDAVARFTSGPAAVRDVGGHGDAIAPGRPAHLAVLDPEARWTVDAPHLHSKSRNSPFHGAELSGRPVHTLLRGAFTLRDGRVTTGAPLPTATHGRPVDPDRPAPN